MMTKTITTSTSVDSMFIDPPRNLLCRLRLLRLFQKVLLICLQVIPYYFPSVNACLINTSTAFTPATAAEMSVLCSMCATSGEASNVAINVDTNAYAAALTTFMYCSFVTGDTDGNFMLFLSLE